MSGTRNNQRIVHAESFQNPATHGKWANPVTIRTLIKLLPENVVECSWEDTIANRRRREFCDKYEGYGDVCRCKLPSLIVFRGMVVFVSAPEPALAETLRCFLGQDILLSQYLSPLRCYK